MRSRVGPGSPQQSLGEKGKNGDPAVCGENTTHSCRDTEEGIHLGENQRAQDKAISHQPRLRQSLSLAYWPTVRLKQRGEPGHSLKEIPWQMGFHFPSAELRLVLDSQCLDL